MVQETAAGAASGWETSPIWMTRILANVTNLLSPITTHEQQSTKRTQRSRPRPISWHPSSDTLVYPKIDVPPPLPPLPAAPSATLSRQNSGRQRKELPPLPEGEHNAAARSRIRCKATRRSTRSTPRRPNLNPTQSLRSSRRRDSFTSIMEGPAAMNTEDLTRQKQQNRRSSPLPLAAPLPSSTVSAEDLRTMKNHNRPSMPPLPLRLPVIAGSPHGPLFRDPWLEDRHRVSTGIFQARKERSVDRPISPKSKTIKPQALMQADKAATTCYESNITAVRKNRDISHVPVSAKRCLWTLMVDEVAPLVFTEIRVQRKPSSGWLLPTPIPELNRAQHIRNISSRDWREDMHGRRQFDGTGYWGWRDSPA